MLLSLIEYAQAAMKNIATLDNISNQLQRIDWSAAWWQPWRAVGQRVAQRVTQHIAQHGAGSAAAEGAVAAALNTENAVVQFVAHTSLAGSTAYEQFIFDTSQVPTRDNLHDFFNGLVWIVFPQVKKRLNALQAEHIKNHGIQATRGPLRDTLTVFDENAAFMHVSPALAHALHERQWQQAFGALRHEWLAHPPLLFGHALFEKLVLPYKSITAHVYYAQAAIKSIANFHPASLHPADWDSHISQQLSPKNLLPKPFLPLPVLGVPGWWAANESPVFYQDAQVFRPSRMARPSAA